jgi:thioredoxin-like negative regulator of GroEL
MVTAEAAVARARVTKPKLVFFTSSRSGQSRRVEGYLAQVLQRRRNHGTFRLHVVDGQKHPELMLRFQVSELPTLVVVENRTVKARLARPRGCREIEELLSPWLR